MAKTTNGKTSAEYRHTDLHPNPLNPRRIFDKYKLDILEESIRANRILVPLTVYRNRDDNKLYILDGERRWRCAQRIEAGEVSATLEAQPADLEIPTQLREILVFDPSTKVLTHKEPIDEDRHKLLAGLSTTKAWEKAIGHLYASSKENPPTEVSIPVNIVDPPTPEANMLYMFHVHNLREQWDLMPTALSLNVLINALGVDDDEALAELTKLSLQHVKRCKILLSYPTTYQSMMLDPDRHERLKANLFIEMYPVLNLYEELGKRVSNGNSRDELTDLFIEKYRAGLIKSVLHFRRILEAKDLLEETDRWDDFKNAASRFVRERNERLLPAFASLAAEERQVENASSLCKDFVSKLRDLKITHTTTKRREIASSLRAVEKEVKSLLESLAGED